LRKFHQDLTTHVLPICLPHGKGCSTTRAEEFASSNCHERSLQRSSAPQSNDALEGRDTSPIAR
jgi:hypothetical protein